MEDLRHADTGDLERLSVELRNSSDYTRAIRELDF